jgi:hypothetical protein
VYIEPDSLTVVIPAITAAALVGGVSFAMSWDALQVVATWAGVRRTWGLPVALDAAILVFTAFWLVAKRRGRPVWFLIGMVGAFTIASLGGNVAHAVADGAGSGWQTCVGAVAAAVFPVTTFAMTHVVAGLLVDPDAEVRQVRLAKRVKAAGAAQVVTPVAPALVPSAPSTATATATDASASGSSAPVRSATVAGRDVRSLPAAERAELRERAVQMARDGRSRSQIAVSLGVGRSTIVAWTAGITAESLSRVVV